MQRRHTFGTDESLDQPGRSIHGCSGCCLCTRMICLYHSSSEGPFYLVCRIFLHRRFILVAFSVRRPSHMYYIPAQFCAGCRFSYLYALIDQKL